MVRPWCLLFVLSCALVGGCGKKDVVTKENFQQLQSRITTGVPRTEVEKILGPGKPMDKQNMPAWVLPDIFSKLKGQPVQLKDVPPDALKDFSGDFVMWGNENKYIMIIFNNDKMSVLWQKGIPGEL